jgi:hypothetical protein
MTHRAESTTTYKDGFGLFFLFDFVLTVIVVRFVWDRYSDGLLECVCGASVGYLFIFYSGV